MDDNKEPQQENYNKRSLKQYVIMYIIIGAIIYAGLYYFVFSKSSNNYSTNSSNGNVNVLSNDVPENVFSSENAQTESGNNDKSTSNSNSNVVNVIADDFSFTPSVINLKANQETQIILTNNGKYPHNLVISGLDVQTKNIMPGQKDSVTFVPSKTGSFQYLCSISGHSERGMVGTLNVQ